MLDSRVFWVTGATGRLGVDLCARLEELGARPVPLLTGDYPDAPRRVAWTARAAPVRVGDAASVARLPAPDHMIHLHWLVRRDLGFAAQVAYEVRQNITDLDPLWRALEDGGADSCRSLVNVSSIHVYGKGQAGSPVDAATCPRPETPYGVAKITAERFLDARLGDLVRHARLCSIASPGEHPTQLMTRLTRSAREQQPIVVNTGHATSLMYIDEVVDLLIATAIEAGTLSKTLNLTAPYVDNELIAETVERVTGRPLHAERRDLSPGVPDVIVRSDTARLGSEWIRRLDLEQLVRRFLAATDAATG